MRMFHVNFRVYLPERLYEMLRNLARASRKYRGRARFTNNEGERDIEWSWVSSQVPIGPGKALDFGNGGSNMSLVAAQAGFDVTAVDLEPVQWTYVHPRITFLQGDIGKLPLEPLSFDLVINCSTVEHVGLAGRYGITQESPDGDIQAMNTLQALLKPDGVMIMTVPVGRDLVAAPLHRIYGAKRLPLLLGGFAVEREDYWIKGEDNRWRLCERETALAYEPRVDYRNLANNLYGLGCFVLRVAP